MVRWCEAVEGEYEGERNAAGEMEGHGTMVCGRQRLYRWRVQGCGQREAVEGRGIYRYPSGTVCTTASGRPARWTGAARTFLPRRRFGRIHASLLLLLFNTQRACWSARPGCVRSVSVTARFRTFGLLGPQDQTLTHSTLTLRPDPGTRCHGHPGAVMAHGHAHAPSVPGGSRVRPDPGSSRGSTRFPFRI